MRSRLSTLIAVLLLATAVAPAAGAATTAAPATCFGLVATIVGTSGADNLVGTSGDDVIQARAGNDFVDGKGGNDVVCGGAGDDDLRGGSGDDLLIGGSGDDLIRGQKGADAIRGDAGDDDLRGGNGRDVIFGGDDDDTMRGGKVGDYLNGGNGTDSATGERGTDTCKAEAKSRCEGAPGPFRLTPDGIGPHDFGTATDIALVDFALFGDAEDEGDPDEDSGWIPSFSIYGTCPNDEVRMVRWGNLRTFFTRSGMAEGEFFSWDVTSTPGHEDLRLQTPRGLRKGDTVAQLHLFYGNATVEFDDVFEFWRWYTDDNPSGLSGSLTGGTLADRISFLQGGPGCGE